MDKLIYTAYASLAHIKMDQAQSSNELANMTSIGFKKAFDHATETRMVSGSGASRYVPVNTASDAIVLDEGPFISTGRGLDIYMRDKTVMAVTAKNGQIAFTRRGDLSVNEVGIIVEGSKHPVLSEGGGIITAPVGADLSVAADGRILATDPQFLDQPPALLGQLMIRDAANTPMIRREDALLEPSTQRGQGGDFDDGEGIPSVTSGGLEGSSVKVANQLVKFMDIARSFEVRIKMINEMKELDESGASLMRMV
jgi:flagellar basal-body rod protein FlgF